MILRKPYAFFIKFFKLFHLIIFVLSSILLYRTSLLYNFMKEFCKDSPNVIGKSLVSTLFVPWVYILIAIILTVNILIIFILIKKYKPYTFYIFNISLYVGVLIVYVISHGVIHDLEHMLIAAKTTLAVRDILNIARLLQTVSVIFYLVRATGFDIKKFDFVRDLQGLDISPEDSEEIEVAIDFEGNVILRKFKKNYREFKYYYKENKFMLNISFIIFIGLISAFIYFSFSKYDKIYHEGEYIRVSGVNISIKDSYILTHNSFGDKIISGDNVLVVLKFSASGSSLVSTTNSMLVIDEVPYYHIASYSSDLVDLGTVYYDQTLSSNYSDYLFVYSVPKSSIGSKMFFKYVDNVESKRGKTIINSYDIKLDPVNLDDEVVNNNYYNVSDVLELTSGTFTLNSYELSDKFVNTYNSCINNECFDFKDVVKASVTREREKALLKVSVDGDNFYNVFKNFGSIDYVYNGNSYSEHSDFNLVTPSKTDKAGVYYIEVDKEVLSASSINLSFNFRNNKYSYVLRGETNG